MTNVTRLDDRRPHWQGHARCLDCRHEWEAVAPRGAVWLECPSCSLVRGRFVYSHSREESHWTCQCGNDLFLFHQIRGLFCPNCGTPQVLS